MFLDSLVNADAVPVLQAAARFAARRHSVLAGNIANLTTPGYLAKDVSVTSFQEQLREAVERRREEFGGPRGELSIRSTDEVQTAAGAPLSLSLSPRSVSGRLLYHDRNNRDLERAMQDLTENAAAFRLATDLLRNRMSLIESAIRERP
ncbi:MAG: flagellar basal body rod protein FlgB [Phycisphaerales bacterium]